MIHRVLSYISQNHMITQGEHILAAVSGGADSVCLLLMLETMKKEMELNLTAVHVEHGIRGRESEEDAHFVRGLCEKLDVPCRVYSGKAREYAKNNGMSLEEGARELRYRFFAQAVRETGADKIAVAHNQNDCAETVLFHLARGTGLKGMRGIAPVRENIIRPLLCVTREEIEKYLAGCGQVYRTDATNLETDYTRNKIRHQVLPVLKEINRQAVSHIYQSTEFISEAAELAEELAEHAKDLYVNESFLMEEIKKEPSLVQRTLIHKLLTECAGKSRDITGIHVRKVQELLDGQTGKRISLPYYMCALRTYGGIMIKKVKPGEKESGKGPGEDNRHRAEDCLKEYEVQPGQLIEVSGGKWQFDICVYMADEMACRSGLPEKKIHIKEIPKKRYTKWFDYDKIKDTLQIRTRRQGDYFVLNGQGKRQKLKDYFINEKIPADERDHIWLLAEASHILWVVGYRISEAYKVTESTKRILEIQVDGGKNT